MVIGGDNLFSLDIKKIINYYKQHQERSIAAIYDIKDKDKAKLYGTAVLDTKYTDHPWGNQITRFEEKPKNPESTLVSTAIYIFRATDLARITDYMSEGNNADTIGSYIDWLIKNEERTGFRDWAWHTLGVNGFVFDGYWFDIGSNESLEQANRLLRKTYSKKILKQEEVCV